MEALLEEMTDDCEYKQDWRLKDFVIEEGKLLFKRGKGCKYDYHSIEWLLCKSCRSLVKHFDLSSNYLELYKDVRDLRKEMKCLRKKLDQLLEDKKE